MSQITEKTSALVRAICSTEAYRAYRRLQKRIDADAERKTRVDALRKAQYHASDGEGDPLEHMETIGKHFEDLLGDEEVRAYLAAENEVCRLLREVSSALMSGVKLELPE